MKRHINEYWMLYIALAILGLMIGTVVKVESENIDRAKIIEQYIPSVKNQRNFERLNEIIEDGSAEYDEHREYLRIRAREEKASQ